MPDMISPVGLGSKPPDLGQGIGLLSNIIGLQQQKQNLQTGAYTQQTAQAGATVAQQNAKENQALAQLLQDPTQVVDESGNPKQDALQKILAVAPTTGAQKAQQFFEAANEKVTFNQSLNNLSDSRRKSVGETMVGVASNHGGREDYLDALDQAVAANPGLSRAALTISANLPTKPHLTGDPATDANMQQQYQLKLDQYGAQMGRSVAASNAGILAPNIGTYQTKEGIQGFNTNPMAAGGIGTAGQPMGNQGITPGTVQLPGGNVGVIGPSGTVQPAGGAATTAPTASTGKLAPLKQPAPNDPKAVWDNYNAQVQGASQLLTSARTAANDPMNGVQPTRFRNQAIMDLIPHADTGPGLRLLNTLASRLPGSTGDAYQDLEHYTAQNSAALAQKMGVPNTNLGAETAAAAAGNVERNPGALAEITRTNDALNTAFDLYNRGLQKVSNNGSDPSRVAAYQQAFGQNLDVNAVRWADAHRRGDTDEIAALTKKLGPQGVAAAQQKLRVLGALAGTGDLP